MFIAIIEKTSRRVLEVLTHAGASLEAMQAYNGTATRCGCPEEVFMAYSEGKEVMAPRRFVVEVNEHGQERDVLITEYTVV